jgi:aminoacyl tRNA synthase complex-interacting multifunctional protein 1
MSAVSQVQALLADVSLTTTAVPVTAYPGASPTAVDAAWAPGVPIGHTEYSWGPDGAEEVVVAEVKAAAAEVPKKQPQQQQQQKKQQKQKQKKGGQPAKKQKGPAGAPNDTPDFFRVEMLVGKIVECVPHPNSEHMWMEQIDVGEAQPRTIVSKLVEYIPQEEMLGSSVIVCANFKPANLRKIKSFGMVLAAKSADGKTVKLVKPAEGTAPGTRVVLANTPDFTSEHKADARIDISKKVHVWERVAPFLMTNAEGIATFKDVALSTKEGPLTVGIPNVPLS